MPDQGEHCPFLNRTDPRCSTYFRLDHLGHAFDYCFDRYKACPVYLELLVERRVRRMCGAATSAGAAAGGEPESSPAWPQHRTAHAPSPLVQVSVSRGPGSRGPLAHRYAQPAAGNETVPHSPRF